MLQCLIQIFDVYCVRLFAPIFGTSFSTFLFFILSSKNGRLSCFLLSSWGYSTSASKIYPSLSFFHRLIHFFKRKSHSLSFPMQINVLVIFESTAQLQRLFASKYCRYFHVISGLHWSFRNLLLALA